MAIFIPPSSRADHNGITPLPPCLAEHPTAIINYRWQPHDENNPPDIPFYWPAPLHDVLFGYSWLADNLGVTNTETSGANGNNNAPTPRSVYVYGSYLGASLAASLALTESHVPNSTQRMTIRGLIAHNGIYNWTMFLPDHPIHWFIPKSKIKNKPQDTENTLSIPVEEEGIFTQLKHQTSALFANPANLFDPFASPCLFFHSSNLYVPDDFTTPLSVSLSQLPPTLAEAANKSATDSEDPESASALLARAAALAKRSRPLRKGYLRFPPRNSTLRLPDTLLLYDAPRQHKLPPSAAGSSNGALPRRRGRASRDEELFVESKNNFKVQAFELAGLMRRSLGMVKFRRRVVDEGEEEENQGLEDEEVWGREIERRVRVGEVASSASGWEDSGDGWGGMEGGLGEDGDEEVREWLRDKIDEEL